MRVEVLPRCDAPLTGHVAPAIEAEGLCFGYPDGTRRCTASTSSCTGASRWPSSGRTGPARALFFCTSTASSGLRRAPHPRTRSRRQEPAGDQAQSGSGIQDPEDQLFLTSVAQTWLLGRATPVSKRTRSPIGCARPLPQWGWRAPGIEPPTICRSVRRTGGRRHRAGHAPRVARARRTLVQPGSRAHHHLADILLALPATKIIATHDLPAAHELCDRVVILDEGRIVADGPAHSVLGDRALLAAHGLELPYGFVLPDRPGRR